MKPKLIYIPINADECNTLLLILEYIAHGVEGQLITKIRGNLSVIQEQYTFTPNELKELLEKTFDAGNTVLTIDKQIQKHSVAKQTYINSILEK